MKLLSVSLLFIALSLTIFSNDITAETIELPKTGQTSSLAVGDDGDQPRGAAWPVPRFTENLNLAGGPNGTITDNLTGLIWLNNANCLDTVGNIVKSGGTLSWQDALYWSNALANGNCGLSDGSVAGSWRLPNRKELMSLTDTSQSYPGLPANFPFINVLNFGYWSSTSALSVTGGTWGVNVYGGGYTSTDDKIDGSLYVWPVRAGQ